MNSVEKVIAVLTAVFVLTSVCVRSAKAETWISTTVTSYHFDRSKDHNERNFGLGFEHQVTENGRIVGGFYKNSEYHWSVDGGFLYLPYKVGPAKVGAMFGAVTGYEEMTVMPVIIPTVAFEGKKYGVNIGVVPSMIGLQLKMRFK
jgi:hypothetical protein